MTTPQTSAVGRRPFGSDGILLIDKPEGMSSAQVVAQVKRVSGAAKVGHAGTLDPFATGLLVICFNQATRLARFFLASAKTYRATMVCGITTDTQDLTGRILRQMEAPPVAPERLAAVMARFKGSLQQQPPAFSALKHQGRPLYQLARQGREVLKPARPVEISRLELLAVAWPQVEFSVTCSAGTYIRTLATDMGAALGCGAHLQALCRTASGPFSLEHALPLQQLLEQETDPANLTASHLISMSQALADYPTHVAEAQLVTTLAHGRTVTFADIPPPGDHRPPNALKSQWIKVVDCADRLLAVLEIPPDGNMYRYCCTFNA